MDQGWRIEGKAIGGRNDWTDERICSSRGKQQWWEGSDRPRGEEAVSQCLRCSSTQPLLPPLNRIKQIGLQPPVCDSGPEHRDWWSMPIHSVANSPSRLNWIWLNLTSFNLHHQNTRSRGYYILCTSYVAVLRCVESCKIRNCVRRRWRGETRAVAQQKIGGFHALSAPQI